MFQENGIEFHLSNNASAFCVYFCEKSPADLHDILENHDFAFDLAYRRALINHGIYHFPIPCKQGSVSYSHTMNDIDRTLEMTKKVLKIVNI